MGSIEPNYSRGNKIIHKKKNISWKILDMHFDKTKYCIMYKVQHTRQNFHITKLSEPLINRNVEKGYYEITE